MLMSLKLICVLTLIVLKLKTCFSDDSIGCDSSEDFQEAGNTQPLEPDFSGDIKTYSDVKIKSIKSTSNNKFEKLYIHARLDSKDDGVDLVIFTTDDFKTYYKEQNATQIFVYINFECSGGTRRTLEFFQPLKDGNYFPPEFSKQVYELVIPTPLYKGFELTTFQEISATDDDLSGFEIIFSSPDSEDSKILTGTLQRRDKKTSFASLELMSILLSMNEKIEFSIIATDTGNPPRSSSAAKVIITADSTNSLPPIPKFVKTVLYGSLTDDLQLPECEIELDPATYSTDVSFRKLFDDEDIFQITSTQNIVHITLTKELDWEFIKGKERLSFDVEASNNKLTEVARTAVSISVPNKKESYFKNDLYKGTLLVKSNALKIEDFELIMDASNIDRLDFELQGQQADSFDIAQDQNILKLSLKTDVSANIWSNITYISLKLLARINSDEIASTNIIIDFIHTTMFFEKSTYKGSINSDGDLVLDPIVLLTNPNTDEVDINLLETDAELFSFTKQGDEIVLKLTDDSSQIEMPNRSYLSLQVEAKESITGVKASCLVFIELPTSKSESYFKNGLYKGTLLVKTNALEIEDFELITDASQLNRLDFELQGQQADSFDIVQNQNILKLSLKPDVTSNIWSNIIYVSLKLMAKSNSEEIASTNIIIDLIHTIMLFQKSAYTGSINSDGDFVLDPIVLLTNPNTDEVDIKLLQTDAELFSFTKHGNEILLKLKDDSSQIEMPNRSYISLQIEAKERTTEVKASCLVFIELPKSKSALKYEKHIYQAQITSEPKLIAENVVLEKDSYNDDIEFSLIGQDAKYFSFQQNQNIIALSLKDNFNPSELSNSSAIWVELKAWNPKEKLETMAVIIFEIVHEILPEFEEPKYIGQITQENVLSIKKLILKKATWKTYTLFEIIGDYSAFFEHTSRENEIEISLKAELPEEAKERNSIVIVVTASNNAIKGYSTVVINLPRSLNLLNVFKRTIQHGKIVEDGNMQILKIDDIEFVKEYNVADFSCKLSGDETKNLDYTVIAPKNVIKLILAAELPNGVLELKFYTTFVLECESKEDPSVAGSTIIFLDLPGRKGQSGCPTPEPPIFIPEFENVFYNFYAKPSYVGSLQSVHAIIKGSDDEIIYSLYVKNEHLRSRINIDRMSGEISLSAITSPGRYYFDIFAQNVVSHGRGQAQGRLDIEALIQCEDHVSVSNSLLIKYLEEEIEHDGILNGRLGNCEFNVFSMEPDNKEYVKIDPGTKMLTMIPTDREDPTFSKMPVPQIEVVLKLDCSSENMRTGRSNVNSLRRAERGLVDSESFVENRSLVLTNDIIFSKDITVLSIMLVDINDNRPEFVYPKQERVVVGFPEDEISMQIFPQHVIQVIAQDKDEGLNAKIRYSIQPNEHFQIDPINGDVLPYSNAMKGINSIQLIVYATDRDGASDGLSSKLTMIIKVLSAEHFTLLTFVNENVKHVETLIEEARNKTGIKFIAVKYATLSSTDHSRLRRSTSAPAQFIQKVWAYAFEGEVALQSKDVKRKLSEGSSDASIFAQTFDEVLAAGEGVELIRAQNVTGYIAGLCVLAVIIVACIGFILWRYVYHRHNHIHDEPGNNLSSRAPANQNFNLKHGAEINIQKQTDILSDAMYEPSFYSKRESVKILGTTTQESTDDGRRRQMEKLNSNSNGTIQENNNDGSESDSSNESQRPRATVTFNELVERIHIESDDEEKAKL